DLKEIFSDWCHQEGKFYDLLSTSADAQIRYRLIRFVRSSITSLDICWASSDKFRGNNGDKIDCKPKLNQPRNLLRPLPLADKRDQKQTILNLLRDDNVLVRREVEALLRSYPHDEF